jgi:hypothetical protein
MTSSALSHRIPCINRLVAPAVRVALLAELVANKSLEPVLAGLVRGRDTLARVVAAPAVPAALGLFLFASRGRRVGALALVRVVGTVGGFAFGLFVGVAFWYVSLVQRSHGVVADACSTRHDGKQL